MYFMTRTLFLIESVAICIVYDWEYVKKNFMGNPTQEIWFRMYSTVVQFSVSSFTKEIDILEKIPDLTFYLRYHIQLVYLKIYMFSLYIVVYQSTYQKKYIWCIVRNLSIVYPCFQNTIDINVIQITAHWQKSPKIIHIYSNILLLRWNIKMDLIISLPMENSWKKWLNSVSDWDPNFLQVWVYCGIEQSKLLIYGPQGWLWARPNCHRTSAW